MTVYLIIGLSALLTASVAYNIRLLKQKGRMADDIKELNKTVSILEEQRDNNVSNFADAASLHNQNS